MKSKLISFLICLILIIGSASGTVLVLDSLGVVDFGSKVKMVVECKEIDEVYTGYAISPENKANSYRIKSGELAPGDSFQIEYNGQGINVGTYSWTMNISVFDSEHNDVTSKYDIEVIPSTITIEKRNATLHIKDAKIQYDGQPKSSNAFTSSGLAEGHRFIVEANSESYQVGDVEQEITYKIVDSVGAEVTSNYIVSESYGSIQIVKRTIDIIPSITSKDYDGEAITPGDPVIVSGSLADGDYIAYFEYNTELKEVTYDEATHKIVSQPMTYTIKIFNSLGRDVTKYYDILRNSVNVSIGGRVVKVKIPDIVKEYDGKTVEEQLNEFIISYIATYSLSDDFIGKLTVNRSVLESDATGEKVDLKVGTGCALIYDNSAETDTILEFTYGSYTINKKSIDIQLPNIYKVYDSEPIDSSDLFSNLKKINGLTVESGKSLSDYLSVNPSSFPTKVLTQGQEEYSLKISTTTYSKNYTFNVYSGFYEISNKVAKPEFENNKVYYGTSFNTATPFEKSECYTVSASSLKTEPGEWTVSAILKSGLVWEDGSTANVVFNYEVYGSKVTLNFTDVNANYMDDVKTKISNIIPATYKAYISVKSSAFTSNLNAGTYTIDESYFDIDREQYDFDFEFKPFTLTILKADATISLGTIDSRDYDGHPFVLDESKVDIAYANSTFESLVSLENIKYTVSSSTLESDGNLYCGDGFVTLTKCVRLVDKDGNILNSNFNITYQDYSKSIKINKVKVTAPIAPTTVLTFNGKEQVYELAQSPLYTISDNVKKDVGNYTAKVSLNNTSYYMWSDSTTADKTYKFEIFSNLLYITLNSISRTYSGEALEIYPSEVSCSVSDITVEDIRFTCSSSADAIVVNGKVYYGSGNVTITSVKLIDEDGNDVTGEYNIIYSSAFASYSFSKVSTTVSYIKTVSRGVLPYLEGLDGSQAVSYFASEIDASSLVLGDYLNASALSDISINSLSVLNNNTTMFEIGTGKFQLYESYEVLFNASQLQVYRYIDGRLVNVSNAYTISTVPNSFSIGL